jgi:hypothetical protein
MLSAVELDGVGDIEPWREAGALAERSLALTRLPQRARARVEPLCAALPATNIHTANNFQLLSKTPPLLILIAYSIALFPFVITALYPKKSNQAKQREKSRRFVPHVTASYTPARPYTHSL